MLPVLLAASVGAFFPAVAFASSSNYYDWGPYYQSSPQVLGITFSSSEGLPAPALPGDLLPPPATGVLPGDFLAPAERLVEGLQLTFTFDVLAREQLRLQLATERLAEAKTLIDSQRYSDAAVAVAGYRDSLQTLASNLQNLTQTTSENVNQFLQQVETTTADQAVVATSLAASAPPAVAETWSQVLSASEVTLDAVADATNQPPIPETLSAGIQELKDQGLITPEESAKLYALDSRSDVRQELDKLVTAGQFPPAEAAKLDTAVAATHPDVYQHQQTVLEYAELRSYQTLPLPPTEVAAAITDWQKDPGDLPPPPEIRPYLYYSRAQDLAQTVDLTTFSADQQTEVAQFYPDAVSDNPTFTEPLPSPSPLPSPQPEGDQASTGGPTGGTYLTAPTGALPGDPTYFLKRWTEGLSTTFTFDSARRAQILGLQAEERLREAAQLIQNPDRSAEYARTLTDYNRTIGAVARIVDDWDRPTPNQEAVAQALEAQAARHNLIIETGYLPPPPDQPETATQLVASTQDVLDASADALGRPALPPALSDRLQDLKAQGLILPEEVDELTRADSRSQVREKIRQLEEEGTFPPAEAKRLDEAQALIAPSDYNQLVELRKIEELNRLRAIQADFAQTATLRATAAGLEGRLEYLKNSIDPSLIAAADVAGNAQLKALYDQLAADPNRPVNAGQFPPPAPLGEPIIADAVLTTCPVGARFEPEVGCVWANGTKLNDYEQYRCSGGQYWSFAAGACVPYQPSYPDGQPVCPLGYVWNWSVQACTTSAGGGIFPSPSPTPGGGPVASPRPGTCPTGSSYQPPRGCVWDDTGRPISDWDQYRCDRPGQYWSFSQKTCLDEPPADGGVAPIDAVPSCADSSTYWSWSDGRCVPQPTALPTLPPFTIASGLTPTNPLYFLDRAIEAVQVATTIGPEAKERVRLGIAQERLGEAYNLLTRGQEDRFRTTLGEYNAAMQRVYNDLAAATNLSDSAKANLGQVLGSQVAQQNLILQKAAALTSESESATALGAATSIIIQGTDRAADLAGEPAVPAEIQTRLDALPADQLTEEQKQGLAEVDNRVEARLALGPLVTTGVLTPADTAVLDQGLAEVDPAAAAAATQLRSLGELAQIQSQSEEIKTKVEENEDVAAKLNDFRANFTPGADIPAEIRPYIRLTRIEEVAQTIRPDIVRLEDFANRADVQLAVASLREEFRPTIELVRQVETYRRNNPNRPLPFELARIEALSTSLGVRNSAAACFLPSPPFPANTPCPPPGAAINFSTVYSPSNWPGPLGFPDYTPAPTGEQLTYGQGPEASSPGVCPNGYHWMYDSGGWCMSNGGNYAPSGLGGSNYSTPYYGTYTPGTSGSTGGPPYYYGSAPTYYTTTPPAGTVPGTGPAPTSPGQCPAGYHWMSDSGGWCMSDGPTYVPGGGTNYYPGYVTPPYSCSSGQYWSSAAGGCIPTGSTPGYYSPNLTQSSCGPGYYWDGTGCIATYYGGSSGPSPANSCQGFSCPSGYWLDYSSCSCRASSTSGGSTYTTPSSGSCTYPSGGCGPNSWYDYGTCSCRSSSTYSTGGSSGTSSSCQPPSSGCPGGWYDYGSCSCRTSSTGTSTPTYSPAPSSTSSGSCPSGYHWMSDNGGWCMSDGAASSGTTTTTTTSSPAPTYSPPPSSEPAPTTTTTTTTTTEPAPAPAPAESTAPAPTTSP